jgi:hypothetical protein
MSAFLLARRPPRWLRAAVAGLLLAFALNSIAHLTHRHDAPASVTHSLACGYCVAFDGLADMPRHGHPQPEAEQAGALIAPAVEVPYALRPRTSARPRAPPLS